MAAFGKPASGEAGSLQPYVGGGGGGGGGLGGGGGGGGGRVGEGGEGRRGAVLFDALARTDPGYEVPAAVAHRCAHWAPFLVD